MSLRIVFPRRKSLVGAHGRTTPGTSIKINLCSIETPSDASRKPNRKGT
jgi:hypothetical protein